MPSPDLPVPARPRRRGLGCFPQLVLLLVMGCAVPYGVSWIVAPWSFYMGSHFHYLPMWQAWGRMHSNTAGGDYALYLYFYPRPGRFRGPRHVTGTAWFCTPRGEKLYMRLGGDFDKNMGLDSDGKSASFYMTSWKASDNFRGPQDRLHLEAKGKWDKSDLVLDDHGSIARSFQPNGTRWPEHTSRPYMGEVVPMVLHPGSNADFQAACAALAKK